MVTISLNKTDTDKNIRWNSPFTIHKGHMENYRTAACVWRLMTNGLELPSHILPMLKKQVEVIVLVPGYHVVGLYKL